MIFDQDSIHEERLEKPLQLIFQHGEIFIFETQKYLGARWKSSK